MTEAEWKELQAALERDREKLRALQQDTEEDTLEFPAFLDRRKPKKVETPD